MGHHSDFGVRPQDRLRPRSWIVFKAVFWHVSASLREMPETARGDQRMSAGELIEIVETRPGHASALRDCLDEVAGERQFLLMTEAPPLEKVERFIAKMIDLGNPQFVALRGNEVLGWCDIHRSEKRAFRHGGEMGIGIRRDWRRRGLGRRLLRAALDQAWARDFRKVELSVFVHNKEAIAFYRDFGFEDCGQTKEFAQLDGSFYDALRMVYFSPRLKESR